MKKINIEITDINDKIYSLANETHNLAIETNKKFQTTELNENATLSTIFQKIEETEKNFAKISEKGKFCLTNGPNGDVQVNWSERNFSVAKG